MRRTSKLPINRAKYNWAKQILFAIGAILVLGLSKVIASCPGEQFEISSSNYPQSLPKIRKFFLSRLKNSTYLDYTGAGVYPDSIIREAFNMQHSAIVPDHNYSSYVKEILLEYLGTNSSAYSVIFLASATQALKTIGENFPWTPRSRFIYTKVNHNSVLGIRKYAVRNNATFIPIESLNDSMPLFDDGSDKLTDLLAFPLEDNFAGTKPSLETISQVLDSKVAKSAAIVADGAAFLPTNPLNLTKTSFHALIVSFYKIFGYPNVGALVIRNDFAKKLNKNTYTANSFTFPKDSIGRLEEDRLQYTDAIAIAYGIKIMNEINIQKIQNHVWTLTRRFVDGLQAMKHSTGSSLCEIYGNHAQNNSKVQGGIVSFNLKKPNGEFYGYASVVQNAGASGFHIRGGCHCNPGACFKSMKLKESNVKAYFDRKKTCGDKYDVVDGIPLGSVRASFGWATTKEDIDSFLSWIRQNYAF